MAGVTNNLPLVFYGHLKKEFCDLYSFCSEDHGVFHISCVLRDAQRMCEDFGIPYSREIELAAVLHDIGNRYDRSKHDIIGSVMAREFIIEHKLDITDGVDVDDIVNAVLHHRSGCEEVRTSPTEIIVASADRGIPVVEKDRILNEIFLRAIVYSLNVLHLDAESAIDGAYDYCMKEFANCDYNIYEPEFLNAYEDLLEERKYIMTECITKDEVRKFAHSKGIGAEIVVTAK